METNKPAKRRTLRFETLDAALAEAKSLARCEREGKLHRTGTFELGQTLGHLATWANFAFDGYPKSVHPPAIVRLIAKLFRNRIIEKNMPPGMRIGRVPNGTLGLEIIPTDEGMTKLRTAFARLAGKCPPHPNPAFGPLTHEEWIKLNLRHAELHFSFLSPV